MSIIIEPSFSEDGVWAVVNEFEKAKIVKVQTHRCPSAKAFLPLTYSQLVELQILSSSVECIKVYASRVVSEQEAVKHLMMIFFYTCIHTHIRIRT